MMNKDHPGVPLPLDNTKSVKTIDTANWQRHSPDQLQSQWLAVVILALGSNYRAEHYLARVHQLIASMGSVQLSTAFQNPDFTATPERSKPDYTNQCVCLHLSRPMRLSTLQQTLKRFEVNCDRQHYSRHAPTDIRKVSMDIDILMIKPSEIREDDKAEIEALNHTNMDANNKVTNNKVTSIDSKKIDASKDDFRNDWLVMADRYPFKAHEVIGIEELMALGCL